VRIGDRKGPSVLTSLCRIERKQIEMKCVNCLGVLFLTSQLMSQRLHLEQNKNDK